MTVWPVQHAKARFSELLDACQREGPQVVSRRGTEAAVLVPIEEWRRLQAAARPSLKELLLAAEARTEALVPPRGQARRPHQRGLGAAQAKAPWRRARLVAEQQ
jgi:prevent-host-death family protein